jgi:hypothetical protein
MCLFRKKDRVGHVFNPYNVSIVNETHEKRNGEKAVLSDKPFALTLMEGGASALKFRRQLSIIRAKGLIRDELLASGS